MQSKPQIIQCLNGLLRHELTVINQYFLHARMLGNWGYVQLEKTVYKQSIRAMKNADKLIQRLFLLEGLPNLQDLGKLIIGESVEEILACDIQAATAQYQDLQKAIAFLEREEDFVSRDLVEVLLSDVDDYVHWLGDQQGLIEDMGLANYLQELLSK